MAQLGTEAHQTRRLVSRAGGWPVRMQSDQLTAERRSVSEGEAGTLSKVGGFDRSMTPPPRVRTGCGH